MNCFSDSCLVGTGPAAPAPAWPIPLRLFAPYTRPSLRADWGPYCASRLTGLPCAAHALPQGRPPLDVSCKTSLQRLPLPRPAPAHPAASAASSSKALAVALPPLRSLRFAFCCPAARPRLLCSVPAQGCASPPLRPLHLPSGCAAAPLVSHAEGPRPTALPRSCSLGQLWPARFRRCARSLLSPALLPLPPLRRPRRSLATRHLLSHRNPATLALAGPGLRAAAVKPATHPSPLPNAASPFLAGPGPLAAAAAPSTLRLSTPARQGPALPAPTWPASAYKSPPLRPLRCQAFSRAAARTSRLSGLT